MVNNEIGKAFFLGLDADGRIIQFDKEFQVITGYSREEAINRKIEDVLIPDRCISEWKKLFSLVTRNKNVENYELPIVDINKQEIKISLTILLMKKKDLQDKHLLIIGRKIGNIDSSNKTEKETINIYQNNNHKERNDNKKIKYNKDKMHDPTSNKYKKILNIDQRSTEKTKNTPTKKGSIKNKKEKNNPQSKIIKDLDTDFNKESGHKTFIPNRSKRNFFNLF
ncbi:MAG: PAS domain-containing protein, partial [Thermoplasmatota archaeon]